MKLKIGIVLILALSVLIVIPMVTTQTMTEIIPVELQTLFSIFDTDGDGEISWVEARVFYYWVEENIKYRYDDENDPDGLKLLEAGEITEAGLGDGREGDEYWQKPIETFNEGYGDCEDMAILELAFYDYWDIESYLALVDTDGDGQTDHAICIANFEEAAFEEFVESVGIADYYDFEGEKFVIVDNAYSDEYGFLGMTDPLTGEPIPDEEIDFTLYGTKTLEDIYYKWWAP
jgi:hypothetical protein